MTPKRKCELAAGAAMLLTLAALVASFLTWERQRELDQALAREIEAVREITEHTMFYAVAPLDHAKELVRKGANVRGRNPNRDVHDTILHWAAAADDAPFVEELIRRGAEVNANDAAGGTPLMSAAGYGAARSTEALLRLGARVNARSGSGASALLSASMTVSHNDQWLHDDGENYPRVVQLLIEHGADVNAADQEGTTPLLEAAPKGELAIVKQLLQAGARKAARNAEGKTAFSLTRAALKDSEEDLRDPHSNTLPWMAQRTIKGQREITRLLSAHSDRQPFR